MNKRIISMLLCAVMLITVFAGCGGQGDTPGSAEKDINKAQLVVAVNPIFAYSEEDYVIAFNDIKNAIQSDSEAATLTSMHNSTSWNWVYREGENWKQRGIYNLARWSNGRGAACKTLNAYSFDDDGTISLLGYTTGVADVVPYEGGTIPSYGVLLSASGNEEEALCYTVSKSGNITIPSGTVTAVESIDGVKTGFLAEDGTERSAVVRIIINSREYWSGELVNSAASEDGAAVTEITYPEISNIPVSEGDIIFISVELNAQLNKTDDVSKPDDTFESDDYYNLNSSTGSSGSSAPDDTKPAESGEITLLADFESRFRIIYPRETGAETLKIISAMRLNMEEILDAEQISRNDGYDETEYEILIGKTNRSESTQVYNELINARPNHAADYIVRMVGTKIVIAATTDYALQLAVDYFMDNYCKNDKSTVPSNLNYVVRENKSAIMLGGNNIASFTIRTEKYPSYMVVTAAKDLQEYIMKQTGYNMEIGKDTASSKYEILIGPNTRGLTGLSDIYGYEITLDGNTLKFNVGSTTAANEAVQVFLNDLKSNGNFKDGYKKSGKYSESAYSLSGGYGLVWYDDFTGDFKNGDLVDKTKWSSMSDTTNGPWYKLSEVQDKIDRGIGGPWITEGVDEGYVMEGMQTRPGIEGENYFLRDDCLVEVTKKSDTGYDAVRLYTGSTMNYRYGMTEARMIMATNNGACSALWASLSGNEIDVYENFGKDSFVANIHTWSPEHIDHNASGDMDHIVVEPAEGEHFYDTFHYIGYEWTDSYMAFYLDGEIFCFVDISDEKFVQFRKLIALKLANGVGTGTYSLDYNPGDYLGDNVDDFYEEQIIDFVRIYQKNDKKSVMRIK